MNTRSLTNGEPFAGLQPWAGLFRNGKGARATACLPLSPIRNGGNGPSATGCPRLSPFRNGANGEHAMACPSLSPFINGGNGQRVRSCRAVAAVWQEVGEREARACHRHLTGLTVRTGGCWRITSCAGAVRSGGVSPLSREIALFFPQVIRLILRGQTVRLAPRHFSVRLDEQGRALRGGHGRGEQAVEDACADAGFCEQPCFQVRVRLDRAVASQVGGEDAAQDQLR